VKTKAAVMSINTGMTEVRKQDTMHCSLHIQMLDPIKISPGLAAPEQRFQCAVEDGAFSCHRELRHARKFAAAGDLRSAKNHMR
jgi:hypothetical protein